MVSGTCSVCIYVHVCLCVGGQVKGGDVAGGQRVKGETRLEMAAEARLGSAHRAMLRILIFILKILRGS